MDEKRKVTIIAGQLVVGGAERQLYLWLAHMDRDKFDPLVITLHPDHEDYWEKPIEDLGVPLFRVSQKPAKLVRLAEIIRILRSFKPDVIHGWHFFSSVYAGLAARFLGVPCLGGIRSEYSPHYKGLDTYIIKANCSAVVANSIAAADAYHTALGRKRQAIFTVPNAVMDYPMNRDTLREELAVSHNLPGDALWICSVGRMDPLKRFDFLLEMAARLRDEDPKFHVILIGDGPERARLEDLASSMDVVDKVSFLGEIPNAGRWMNAMDIFCFPSTSEGLPNAVMEAAAAGLPIVAWRLPFCEELLPDKSQAMLVEPGNLEDMSLALSNLLDSGDLRTQIGAAARSHIMEHFGLERYIQNMTTVYDYVITRDNSLG